MGGFFAEGRIFLTGWGGWDILGGMGDGGRMGLVMFCGVGTRVREGQGEGG